MAIDMQKQAALVSLEKAMTVSLEKGNDPGDISARVMGFMDVSYSMEARYRGKKTRKLSGTIVQASEMESTVTRDLGLVLTGLDDDGVIPMWAFDSRLVSMGEITEDNHEDFVADWLASNSLGGGTDFMPIFREVMKAGPSKDSSPIVPIVHTDGVASDKEAFKQNIINSSGENVFWVFMGHGVSLDFLRDLDTMGGRVVDNVALIEVDDATKLSDAEYYDAMINEFVVDWYPAARKAGVITR